MKIIIALLLAASSDVAICKTPGEWSDWHQEKAQRERMEQQQRQQTFELRRQNSELRKQTKELEKINKAQRK